MHLKVFFKLKKPYKLALLGKYIKKTRKKKSQKNPNKKKPKKPTGLVFFFKPGFFPTLPRSAPGEVGQHGGS
jgi:hypothetical protein